MTDNNQKDCRQWCQYSKCGLKTRAENVWKNCGGVVDISSATFKDVNHEEMLNAVQRYCNYLYIKGIEIKSKYGNNCIFKHNEAKKGKGFDDPSPHGHGGGRGGFRNRGGRGGFGGRSGSKKAEQYSHEN